VLGNDRTAYVTPGLHTSRRSTVNTPTVLDVNWASPLPSHASNPSAGTTLSAWAATRTTRRTPVSTRCVFSRSLWAGCFFRKAVLVWVFRGLHRSHRPWFLMSSSLRSVCLEETNLDRRRTGLILEAPTPVNFVGVQGPSSRMKPAFAVCTFQFASGNELGFTVASPAYDQAFDPPAFLGVSGVDFTVQVCFRADRPVVVAPLVADALSALRGPPDFCVDDDNWGARRDVIGTACSSSPHCSSRFYHRCSVTNNAESHGCVLSRV